MIVTYKILNTTPGAHVVFSSALRNVTPLKVRIDGDEYDIIYSPSVPTNRKVAYRSGTGALIFPTDVVFNGTQRVYCQYKLG